jgi:RHS repeat-associated protein
VAGAVRVFDWQPSVPPIARNVWLDRLRLLLLAGFKRDVQMVGQRAMLVKNLSLPNGASITNSYDSDARLLATVLINSGGSVLNSHNYGYNLGNQRTQQVFTAGNYVNYSYDNVGQLIGAAGKEAGGGASRLHEQFAYTYDAAGNLGNRVQNLLTNSFNVNNLNELTTETNGGTLTVAGTTTSAATNVSVYGTGLPVGAADIYADRTWARGGAIWANGANSYTATATDAYGRTSTDTSVSYLQSSNFFAYDPNGNLCTNGNQTLAYDDENQLVAITVSNSWRSEFSYDGKLRRRIRKEFTWSGSWLQTNETHYIYDGNLVVQERSSQLSTLNNQPSVTYTRGNDLSGSLQRAGGIGGLLARTDNSLLSIYDPLCHAYYHSDGNGNITALLGSAQNVTARYFYDPFGNTLSIGGALAEQNRYRFSSKEWLTSSSLYYYGYRPYDPLSQRWVSRDPSGEIGFESIRASSSSGTGDHNWYRFVHNNSIAAVDPFGLWKFKNCKPQQINDITTGLKGACAAAQSAGCFGCLSRNGQKGMNRMCDDKAGPDEMTFVCEDANTNPLCETRDGYSYPGSRTSHICFPLSNGSGGAGCVALHEAGHAVGGVGDDTKPKAKGYDSRAYDVADCAGCPRTPGF